MSANLELLAAMMEDYEERAAILEFDAGLPRTAAESQAWAMVKAQNDKAPDG